MSHPRRTKSVWIGSSILTALLLLGVVIAVPSFAAPEKIFSLNAPPTLDAGTHQDVKLRIKNETPSGNSSINSLEVYATGNVTIDDVSVPSGSPTWDETSISISNIPPIKNRNVYVITMDLTVGPADGCFGTITWDAKAWTGSSFSGENFRLLNDSYSNLVTNVSAGCYLAWSPAPADGTVGSTIPVGVKVYNGNNVEVTDNRSVSLIVQPEASVTVTGTPDASYPFSFSVTGTAAGQYTATASTTGMTDITANFTLLDTNSSISGQKWRDHDNDGVKDADEAGLGGWLIKAYDGSGAVAGTATTAANGNYTISGLTAGTSYTVCEFSPAEESGFEYRGWIQSVPSANTLCDGKSSGDADFEDAEPNGYSVSIAGPAGQAVTGKDFFNVRTITIPGDTITVTCDPTPPVNGQVYTVGDGINEPKAEVTIYPDGCKPGEYVFESWVSGGEQTVAFYPTFPKPNPPVLVAIEQNFQWVIDGDKTQSNLYYDDDVEYEPGKFVPERKMLFCKVDGQGNYADMPDPLGPSTNPDENDIWPHTTCLMDTWEEATSTGVYREDRTITLVDGTVRRK